MRPDLRTRCGIGLVAGATLLAELVLTRVLSAGLFHHLAFVVVSTALLGTGAAGVVVSARPPDPSSPEPDRRAPRAALAFAASLPICFILAQLVAVEPLLLAEEPRQIFRLGVVYLLLGLPFFFAGISIAHLLSAYSAHAPSLYAADLVGAAAGSLLALLAPPLMEGQDALLLSSALSAAGAWALGAPASRDRKWAFLLGAALLLVCTARAVIDGPGWLPLHISRTKTTRTLEPFARVLSDPARRRSTAWTSGGRVDHVVFSPSTERLVIDAGVAAVRVPLAGHAPTASDATLPYELRPQGRVLIIGAGAGWEIAEAMAFGAREVVGVEINPAVAAAIPAELAHDPRVRVEVDEGRSFAERAQGPFDAVVMIHTISNAASASGALHLAEDYLLTKEAMQRLLALLGDDGLLFITRPETQLPRLISTIRAASPDRPLATRLMAWAERSRGSSFYGAVLVSPNPLGEATIETVRARVASRRRLRMLAGPDQPATDPTLAALLAATLDLGELQAQSGLLIEPPTDDRPFFHQRRSLRDLRLADLTRVFGSGRHARMALEDLPVAEVSSVIVLIETTVLGGLALALAVLFTRRRKQQSTPGTLRPIVYFSCLGLGFMFIEIALVQRLGLVLGRGALTFAVVFSGLLLGAGAGSHMAARWSRPQRAPFWAAAAALVLAVGLPTMVSATLAWPLPARVVAAGLLSGSVGFVLGAPFPLGLVRVGPGMTPLAFATNAFTSVAATVLALLVAAEVGFSWTLVVAFTAYLVAGFAFPRPAG